jgi:dimethylamine/trimethylamine dehydrogenase
VAALECRHVILATGARWLADGTGHTLRRPVLDPKAPALWTPADILAGPLPDGHVVIYDDDQYYMANVLADVLLQAGRKVTFVTPGIEVASWTVMTDEQARIQARLMQAGVAIHLARKIAGWDGATASLASIYDGSVLPVSGDALLVVGARAGNDSLERELRRLQAAGSLPQIQTIRAIGDCHVPGAIYSAVYSGHRAAREFGEAIDPDAVGYIRERVALA